MTIFSSNKKFFSCFILICFLVIASLAIKHNVNAADSLMEGKVNGVSVISPGCLSTGDCKMNDFIGIAIKIADIILGLSGSAALLFFIYGGVMFLISGGSQERVNKGKQIIIGSIIGLFIIFGAYTIIAFTLDALGLKGTGGHWFDSTPQA